MNPKIQVSIRAHYVPAQSSAFDNRYFFSYFVEIKNTEDYEVKLLRRRWVFTDAIGRQQIMEGEGVVGAQPVIPSGDTFTYHSCVMMKTPVGMMEGSYQFQRVEGELFDCSLNPIRLADPFILN